jgi:hypothetical protein
VTCARAKEAVGNRFLFAHPVQKIVCQYRRFVIGLSMTVYLLAVPVLIIIALWFQK